jgi:nucleoside phosphorylase
MGMADPSPPDARADLLLAAAFGPELDALEQWLGRGMEGRIGDVHVVARAVGVGLVAASAGAASSLARTNARAVVLLGTCGSYSGSNLALEDVVVSGKVQLADPAVLAGSMQFPESMRTQVESHVPICAALARCGAHPADVATTLGITVDDALADFIGRRSGASVEHLEAFAVSIACASAGVPFAALLGVANGVGSRGREEWRENHRRASARAVELAMRWIREGAKGSPAERR